MSAMNSYINETGNINAKEPGAISTFDRAFAVPEVVGKILRIKNLIQFESTLRGFSIALFKLWTILGSHGYRIGFYYLTGSFVNQGKSQFFFTDLYIVLGRCRL